MTEIGVGGVRDLSNMQAGRKGIRISQSLRTNEFALISYIVCASLTNIS